jgi:tetratricopeptide (TPR) repeat protein
MKKNIISRLRNISDLFNDEILNKLGWNNLEENTSLPGLEEKDIILLDIAISKNENNIDYLRFCRGLGYLEQGYPKSALKDFKYLQELQALDMTYSKWAIFIGLAYIGMGKSWRAITEIETYINENGASFDTYFWLGYAYYRTNVILP